VFSKNASCFPVSTSAHLARLSAELTLSALFSRRRPARRRLVRHRLPQNNGRHCRTARCLLRDVSTPLPIPLRARNLPPTCTPCAWRRGLGKRGSNCQRSQRPDRGCRSVQALACQALAARATQPCQRSAPALPRCFAGLRVYHNLPAPVPPIWPQRHNAQRLMKNCKKQNNFSAAEGLSADRRKSKSANEFRPVPSRPDVPPQRTAKGSHRGNSGEPARRQLSR
jgi:hypothetical protein